MKKAVFSVYLHESIPPRRYLMRKKVFILLVCLSLLCAPAAGAEFSDTLTALTAAADAGEAVDLLISLRADALGVSDKALSVLTQALSPLSLRLTVRGNDGAVSLFSDDETLYSFSAEGLTGAQEKTPLLPLTALKALFLDAAPILYDALAPTAVITEAEKSLSIKNVGYSKKQTVYTLDKDAANALLPTLHELLDAPLRQAVSNAPYREAFLAYLAAFTFTDQLTVKRMADQQGADIGVQITAKITDENADKRSLTLYGGYKEGTGAYLSFSCPAAKGNNGFKLVLALSLKRTQKQAALTLTADVTRRLANERYTLATDVSLKNKLTDGEAWSGEIKRAETVAGVKTTWTLTPDIRAENGALSGDIGLQKLVDKVLTARLTAHISLSKGGWDGFSDAAHHVSLTGLDDEGQEKALMPLMAGLSALISERFSALDETDRALLQSIFYTDLWMNGPSAALPENTPQKQMADSPGNQNEWTVTQEEEQP